MVCVSFSFLSYLGGDNIRVDMPDRLLHGVDKLAVDDA